MGVVVNNSILLVEAMGRLKEEMPHLPFDERVIEWKDLGTTTDA